MQGSRFPQNRPMMKYGVRSAMRGHVFASAMACLLPMAAVLAFQLLPLAGPVVYVNVMGVLPLGIAPLSLLFSFLLTTFVTDPMGVGVAQFFLQLNRNSDELPSPLSVANCFGPGYFRLVGGMLLRTVYVGSWQLIPIAIGALIPGTWEMVEVSGQAMIVITDLGYAFIVLGMIAMLYRELSYMMVRYVLAEYPSLSPMEAMRKARELTRGRLWELLLLQLSFFGWLMLASIPPFIVAFYVYPYVEGVTAAYFLAFDAPEPQAREDIYAGG